MANVSQSSASSHELTVQAVMTKRVEVPEGSVRTLIAKRGRRLESQRMTKKRREYESFDIATKADLLEKEGKDAWSKFRACCNHIRSDLVDAQGDFLPFDGIEDRWVNENDTELHRFGINFAPTERLRHGKISKLRCAFKTC